MAEQLPEHVRATVVGVMPVRDSFSREAIKTGGVVRLDPTTINVGALVAGGSIEVLTDGPAKAEKKA